jgi:hypothetical protein
MSALQTYNFQVQLAVEEIDDDLEYRVLEARCDDTTLWSRDGEVFLIFHRKARDMSQAIRSALDALEAADVPIVRVTDSFLDEERFASN